ncbi:hypothetical protein HN924_00585 [Candidatus Woesearchaeota archaeon]|jgi:hypothetical protein|nr:hypothetical protein [Candidatus Woesearchaeota archaeon]MBT7062449.1 hypothetical protein [Candidatus Woesearchaeota archaeon]
MNPKLKYLLEKDTEISVSWILKIIMLVSGIYLLFWQQEYYWAVNCFISFTLAIIPSVFAKSHKVNLPWGIDLFITITLLTNVLGYVLNFYATLWWWDIIVHGTAGMLVALLAFSIVFILNYHTTKVKIDIRMMFLFIIFFTIAMGALMEVWEWTIDLIVFGRIVEQSNPLLTPLNDTMKDIVVDTIGGIIVAFIGIIWIKNTPKEKLRRDLNYKYLTKFVEKEF